MYSPTPYRFLLLLTFLVFGGCAATPVVDDTIVLKPGEGLLAIGIVGNWKGNESTWHEAMEYIFNREGEAWPKKIRLRSNDDAQLLPLPPGRYRWSHVTIGGNRMFLDPEHGFVIEPGKILYVGDITHLTTLKMFSLTSDELSVRDNQTATLARLKQEYPELMNRHPVVTRITTVFAKR